MSEPRTICVECRHHVSTAGPQDDATIWYYNDCGSPSAQPILTRDPVSGVMPDPDDHKPSCRTINEDGECPFFEPKP